MDTTDDATVDATRDGTRRHSILRGAKKAKPGSKLRLGLSVVAAVALVAALVPAWMAREHFGFGATEKTAASSPAPSHASARHGAPKAPAQQPPAQQPGSSYAPGGQAPGTPQQPGNGGTEQPTNPGLASSAGPVSDIDKELLVKVRQANLWELQAGRLAQENGTNEAVKRAGLHLMDGHSRLDQIVREISKALSVPIPDQPTAEQQAWVKQLQGSKGQAFDWFFANQLRVAHGKVFVLIAKVRSTTQNSVIRDLAIEANLAVSDHLEVLEDTGMVEPKSFEEVQKAVLK